MPKSGSRNLHAGLTRFVVIPRLQEGDFGEESPLSAIIVGRDAQERSEPIAGEELLKIRACYDEDFETIWAIINDGAQAYDGIIPTDRWSVPYMSREKLRHEIEQGVVFRGCDDGGELTAVMGLQHVQDVTLIRHAYVRTSHQRRGLGAMLLAELRTETNAPVLIGTWADADWAIHFYEKHGFRKVSPQEKDRLLKRYWSIPERQVETSVVLADDRWLELQSDRLSDE
jgi:GNAT superfamily N-acetyltransferase